MSITLAVTPEEAARWQEHLKLSKRNAHTPLKTSRSTEMKIREMISNRESNNQIIKRMNIGSTTLNRIKREMVQEGVL